MRRRLFITLLGGAAASWPLVARAQPVRRVAILMNGAATDATQQSYIAAFMERLQQIGWVNNRNIHTDIRWSAGDATLAKIYAAQLIGLQPDVILAVSTVNLTVVEQATSTIPVVFIQVSDPVEQGFVASLTKPGGNLTGFSAYEFATAGKWLDLLKDVAPQLDRVGVLSNPEAAPQSKFFMHAIETAASSLGLKAIALPVRVTEEVAAAVETFARQPNGGLILPTDTFVRLREGLVIDLATRNRLPTISWHSEFPKEGGLMSYSIDINYLEQYGQAAAYVDRILKGIKPSDLPVQRVDKYRLVLNLKTAKALGLTVPQALLATADEVIE